MLRHDIDRVSGFGLGAGEQDAEQGGDFRYGMHVGTLRSRRLRPGIAFCIVSLQ